MGIKGFSPGDRLGVAIILALALAALLLTFLPFGTPDPPPPAPQPFYRTVQAMGPADTLPSTPAKHHKAQKNGKTAKIRKSSKGTPKPNKTVPPSRRPLDEEIPTTR